MLRESVAGDVNLPFLHVFQVSGGRGVAAVRVNQSINADAA